MFSCRLVCPELAMALAFGSGAALALPFACGVSPGVIYIRVIWLETDYVDSVGGFQNEYRFSNDIPPCLRVWQWHL